MSDANPTKRARPGPSFAGEIEGAALLVTCGPGGVGKTTTAAALGLAAARAGRKVVVVTVDPARRLADALGLPPGAAADAPHHVADVAGPGELWALMLDAGAAFDRLVREQTATTAQADAILENRVYRAISGSLAGAQEYMAIERLHQLYTSGEWDLVIVDTPPSRHAIDLLEAPDRLFRFLGHPVYRTLTVGQRTFAKVTNAAASMFLWAVRRLAGPQIVEDTLQFFRALSDLEPGLRRRAGEVAALLRSDVAHFLVVTSPRSEAVGESTHLANALVDRGFAFRGLIVNLIHPMPVPLAPADAERLADLGPGPLADHVAWHDELMQLATLERAQLADLITLAGERTLVELPLLDVDVHDLDGLGTLASRLAGTA